MNTFWKIVKNQARQFHVSATEMLSVQWSFEKVLHEVVHGVLVARERPCTKAQGQHLVVRILVFAPHRSVLTTNGLTGGGCRALNPHVGGIQPTTCFANFLGAP
jgi:hypothetical protein